MSSWSSTRTRFTGSPDATIALKTCLPGPDGFFRSKVFPGFWLDPEALYAEDLDRLIEILDQGLATPEHAAFAAHLAQGRTEGGGLK